MTAPLVTDPDVDSARRVRLDVSGMSCAACASRVETRLNKVPGVRASVNFATRVATIDAVGIPVDELCRLVEQAGYQAGVHEESAAPDRDPDADHARSLLRRLIVAAVLFVPLADLSTMFAMVPTTRFGGWGYLLVALAAPIVTWAAWPFYRVAVRNAGHRTASMETLISVGIVAATSWSLSTVLVHKPPGKPTEFGRRSCTATRSISKSPRESPSSSLPAGSSKPVPNPRPAARCGPWPPLVPRT